MGEAAARLGGSQAGADAVQFWISDRKHHDISGVNYHRPV